MREHQPFLASDLEELHARLLSQADRVVPMRDVYKGDRAAGVIGLRHDVDDNPGSFDTALRMAEWEFDHGYSSTYFLLHTAPYWNEDMLCRAPLFEEMGHEVGIHVNAVAEALRSHRQPAHILRDALEELRSSGVRVEGCVAHGERECYDSNGKVRFVNDEMFSESPRPKLGAADRKIVGKDWVLQLRPVSREEFGLAYDATWLGREQYLSDSGGRWSRSFDEVVASFGAGQLHVLVHPDWWSLAFQAVIA